VTRFDDDPHPGRPRILFIGHAESTHAHAWIDLLAGADLQRRMFALPGGVPPDSWEVRTYVSTPRVNASMPERAAGCIRRDAWRALRSARTLGSCPAIAPSSSVGWHSSFASGSRTSCIR
jgi:hypothetical protein